jgi:hypothetical protein
MTGVPRAFRQQKEWYSVNACCLDAGTVEGMKVKQMDGVNWEQSHPKGGSGSQAEA